MLYAIAYDVGTTGVKTCLFAMDKEVRLLAGEYGAYGEGRHYHPDAQP